MVDEPKRKRGRPLKDGAKRKRMEMRVTEDFYKELKELSGLEGESCVDYIIESVRLRGALTRINHSSEEDDIDIYEDYADYEEDDYDEFEEE